MYRILFLALLSASPLCLHAAPQGRLDAATAQDRQCLMAQVYDRAPTLKERQARIEPALKACVTLQTGASAAQARALALRNAPLVPGSQAAEAMLEGMRGNYRSWLRHVVAYCHAERTAQACDALLERTTPQH